VLMRHLELMNKFLLLTSLLVGYAYAMEFFIAWYSGNQYEMAHFLVNRPTGPTGGRGLDGGATASSRSSTGSSACARASR
jgi:hypothetical protein